MSLEQHVQDRYSAQILVNLTRPQDSTATTIDTARLTDACDDVKAMLEVYANAVYVDTLNTHTMVCVPAVIAILQAYNAQTLDQYNSLLSAVKEQMKDVGLVGARAKVRPTTNSKLTPSNENPTNGIVRPDFDRIVFENLIPDSRNHNDDGILP